MIHIINIVAFLYIIPPLARSQTRQGLSGCFPLNPTTIYHNVYKQAQEIPTYARTAYTLVSFVVLLNVLLFV